jgi:hypothetical protein
VRARHTKGKEVYHQMRRRGGGEERYIERDREREEGRE